MFPRITSRQNAVIKAVIKLRQKKNRDLQNQFIFEGTKLFKEALDWNVGITEVFVTAKWQETTNPVLRNALEILSQKGTMVYETDTAVFEALSSMKMPEGILCTAQKQVNPVEFSLEIFKKDKSFCQGYVILEDVQDPGNVGTILRTADAAGFGGVICSDKTADIYNEKVLRAAMGSVFHLPVIYSEDLCKVIEALKVQGVCIVGSSLEGTDLNAIALKKEQSVGLVLGNESKGMSSRVAALCDGLYKLPMYGHAESLNVSVAAGILMYDLARKIHP